MKTSPSPTQLKMLNAMRAWIAKHSMEPHGPTATEVAKAMKLNVYNVQTQIRLMRMKGLVKRAGTGYMVVGS